MATKHVSLLSKALAGMCVSPHGQFVTPLFHFFTKHAASLVILSLLVWLSCMAVCALQRHYRIVAWGCPESTDVNMVRLHGSYRPMDSLDSWAYEKAAVWTQSTVSGLGLRAATILLGGHATPAPLQVLRISSLFYLTCHTLRYLTIYRETAPASQNKPRSLLCPLFHVLGWHQSHSSGSRLWPSWFCLCLRAQAALGIITVPSILPYIQREPPCRYDLVSFWRFPPNTTLSPLKLQTFSGFGPVSLVVPP